MEEDGHIVLGVEVDKEPLLERISRTNPLLKEPAMWDVTEEDEIVQEARSVEQKKVYCDQVVGVLKSVRGGLLKTTKDLTEESKSQYIYSVFSLKKGIGELKADLLRFLRQPVWIARKDKKPKQYSRLTLFAVDSIRFGGTFAAIFVALFVTLNYQSFWQIITPYLDPMQRVSSANGSIAEVDSALRDKLLRSPMLATAGKDEGNLLQYLPAVGPPENRIIIPKLNLNVPLVTPSYASLLKEDWVGVEHDIQKALEGGVVHYPGTARPGQAGNFFVTGHSSYYPWADGDFKTVFARLHELSIGDEYWVYYGGDKHRYIVTNKKEVKPSDVTVLDQPSNKRTGTLMTCTPVGTTLRRLIITSQEVDPHTGIAMEVGQKETRVSDAPRPEALPI